MDEIVRFEGLLYLWLDMMVASLVPSFPVRRYDAKDDVL